MTDNQALIPARISTNESNSLKDASSHIESHISYHSKLQNSFKQGNLRSPLLTRPSVLNLDDILSKAKEAPSSTTVISLPEKKEMMPSKILYNMLGQVQLIESLVSITAAYARNKENPAPIDISSPVEVSRFVNELAKWRYYAVTGGLLKSITAYIPVSEVLAQSMSKEILTVNLHLEFLKTLFDGFSLPKRSMLELDSILTNVFEQLKSLKISVGKESPTLNHLLNYYYPDLIEGTGGKDQPPGIYTYKLRTFYLQVSQSSWSVAVGKSSVTHIKFNMNYLDMTTTMNASLVEEDKSAIKSAISTMTGKTSEEINHLMNVKVLS